MGKDDETIKQATDEAAKQAADEAAKQAADEAVKQATDEAVKQAADDDTEILDATVPKGASAPAFDALGEKKYDAAQYQDETRSYIAYWLLFLLTLLVLGGFGMLFAIKDATYDHLKSILELIFGPIVALVSAATGFYFGAQQPAKKS